MSWNFLFIFIFYACVVVSALYFYFREKAAAQKSSFTLVIEIELTHEPYVAGYCKNCNFIQIQSMDYNFRLFIFFIKTSIFFKASS